MKKVILLLLIAAVVFSCKKNEPTTPQDKKVFEVSFNVTTILPDAGREDWTPSNDVPLCDPEATPVFAKIKVTGLPEGPDPGPGGSPTTGYYDVPVYYTNGQLFTQTLEVEIDPTDPNVECTILQSTGEEVCCITLTVTEFYLYDADGNIIKAAPLYLSEFQQFVEHPLNITFELCEFTKMEIPIDVLCFIPDVYDLFGFFWFEITEITVREICFFGDICVDWFPYNIDGDKLAWWEAWLDDGDPQEPCLYAGQVPNGIAADMPAIFELQLKKWIDANNDGIIQHPDELFTQDSWVYSNEGFLGVGQPLCFRYADYDNEEDVFFVTLFIYAPYGDPTGEFSYGPPGDPHGNYIWQFTDDALLVPNIGDDGFNSGGLDTNGDGVIEFVWGNCVQSTEYLLTPLGK